MMTPEEKAEDLIYGYSILICPYILAFNKRREVAISCSITCCNEVLSYMGADRGYEFWSEVKYILQTKQNEKKRI